MSDVDFEEQNWQTSRFGNEEKAGSKMANFILKIGLVKNLAQANYILIGMAVVFASLTIYFFWKANGGSSSAVEGPSSAVIYQQIQQM